MNKRGQFFLIAAVVIAGIIITLGAINITVNTPSEEDSAFYDLSKEIDYESNKLIDYGVYQKQDVKPLISALASNYSAANPDTEMLFVYGSGCSLTVAYYNQTSSGSFGIDTGGGPIEIETTEIKSSSLPYSCSDDSVSIKFSEESELTFELSAGENFFIVLKKKSGDETLVAKE